MRPLMELFDIFNGRKATDPLDRVYALLGMCSDDLDEIGFSADYDASWKDVCRKLVLSWLSGQILSLHFLEQKEVAVIESKGCVLGEVESVYEQESWVYFKSTTEKPLDGPGLRIHASVASIIKPGDVICLLKGGLEPTVIRVHADYATVITTTMPLRIPGGDRDEEKWMRFLLSISDFPHHFLLVWDWNYRHLQLPHAPNSQRGQQKQYDEFCPEFDEIVNFETLTGVPTTRPKRCTKTGVSLERLHRVWNAGQILDDTGNFERSEMHVLETIRMFDQILNSKKSGEAEDLETLKFISECLGERSPGQNSTSSHAEKFALRSAARHGYDAVVRHLIEERGLEVEVSLVEGIRTPLDAAVSNGQEHIVRLLLDYGLDTSAAGDALTRLLKVAINRDDSKIVRILLERGADMHSKYWHGNDGNGGETALHHAAVRSNPSVIEALLQHGARVDAKDWNGQEPLHYLAFNHERNGEEATAAAQVLLDHGADLEAKDREGQTPSTAAVLWGFYELLRFLFDKGAGLRIDAWKCNNKRSSEEVRQFLASHFD